MSEEELLNRKYEILEKLAPHLATINAYVEQARRKYALDAGFEVRLCDGVLNLNVVIETDTFAAKILAKQLEQRQEVE